MNAEIEQKEDILGTTKRSRVRHKVGIVLIVLSGVFWFSIFAVPFAPVSVGWKSVIAGSLFVAVQISWWTGAALAGPQVVSVIKGWFTRNVSED